MTLMHGIGGDETPASPVIQIKKTSLYLKHILSFFTVPSA